MFKNKPILIILTLVVFLMLGLGIYFYTRDKTSVPITKPSAPTPLSPQTEPQTEPQIIIRPPEAEQELIEPKKPAIVLPGLDDSDQLMRDAAVGLTRHEGINAWLSPNELIRKIVVFVDNIAKGRITRQGVSALAPKKPFTATKVDKQTYLLDVDSYSRYDRVTNILLSLDTKRTTEFYILLKPLFNRAYEELGYPEVRDFDAVLLQAIDRLLAAPILPHPVRLIRPVVVYRFEDPDIQGLGATQKQLIRMGPENTAAIQTKLKAFAAELRNTAGVQ